MTKIQPSGKTPQLGYFLEYRYWVDALNLIEYQLSMKPKNKHFNTLSMFHYERLGKKDKKRIATKIYFSQRVANNLLYGLEEEFATYSYPIPKSNLGLRKYRFFTYPMRVAYYAVGLYLVQLSQELVQQYYKQHSQIHSDYGGYLAFDEKTDKLFLSYNNFWYKPHYRRFRSRVRSELKGNVKDKIVIRVDIQNYFEEISIPILLNFLSEYVKPSIQREMQYDQIAKGQISAFFDFIANGRNGIPQTDNDILSSFIGHLYLVFSDLLLDQEISKDRRIVRSHSIVRYMDDMYISLTFQENIPVGEREIYISGLAARIADSLYQKLGLRLNTKTKLYWLSRDMDKEDLLKNLKRVSPNYEIPDDDKKTDPKDRVKLIFTQLEKLKKRALDPTFDERSDLDDEILKEVYDESIGQLLKSKANRARIQQIFSGFNFDLVIAQPREILIILLIDSDATADFAGFLLKKRNLSSRDIYLVLNFLCQTDFKSAELIKLLRDTPQMVKIMTIFTDGRIATQFPGYFGMEDNQTLKLAQYANVIEQIRLRVQFERRNEYSVGLNHLLNEVHAICYKLDIRASRIPEKVYDANKTGEFLKAKQVPHSACLKIRNLFDRRNKNPVSHPDQMAWPVSKDEYFDYRNHVGICLNHLL